jgi:two-component sensor histidine kinase
MTIDIPDVQLGIDTAIPLGLLINEAVTNSLKYGIPDKDPGEIFIALTSDKKKSYTLLIGDDGIGFPETINFHTSKSLGLKLINNLARQLGGTIAKDLTKKGTNYIVRFREAGQNTQFHSVA